LKSVAHSAKDSTSSLERMPRISMAQGRILGISPLARSRFAPSWSVEMTDIGSSGGPKYIDAYGSPHPVRKPGIRDCREKLSADCFFAVLRSATPWVCETDTAVASVP
jgi:hypothetical protein